jgi:hypothetical protein
MLTVEAETSGGLFMIQTILLVAALNAGAAGTDGCRMNAVSTVCASASGPVYARMMPDGFYEYPVQPTA